MQIPILWIDSLYYGKFTLAPLNIVLYNVFSEHGSEIYGKSQVRHSKITMIVI